MTEKSPYYKVKSKINGDIYYTSKDLPEKIIDGKTFISVKKKPSDREIFYMLKEMLGVDV